MTSLLTGLLGLGPAAAVTGDVPDLHHFRGSFGGAGVIPLWRDENATQANITAGLLDILSKRLGQPIGPEDLFAYTYAILSAPAYVELFSEELVIPGPRLPITIDGDHFWHAVGLGRQLVRLHTYGERMLSEGQKPGSLPFGTAKCTVAVSEKVTDYPRRFDYDSTAEILCVGDGQFDPVSQEVFEFALSDFKVLKSWLSYRMAEGAGRHSSELDKIRPVTWTADITEELLRLIWILEATVALRPALNSCLKTVLEGIVIRAGELPSPLAGERRAPSVNSAIGH
jgi:Type ISP C-terminal specificity domain